MESSAEYLLSDRWRFFLRLTEITIQLTLNLPTTTIVAQLFNVIK
jgi:hypothetical protein